MPMEPMEQAELKSQVYQPTSLQPNEVYSLVKPILYESSKRGGRIPTVMPSIMLSDISEDPTEAQRILDSFKENLPLYMKENRGGFLNVQEQWEVPPVSSSLRIMGRVENNAKEQIVDVVKKVANSKMPMGVGVVK